MHVSDSHIHCQNKVNLNWAKWVWANWLLNEVGLDEVSIGQSGYWTKWEWTYWEWTKWEWPNWVLDEVGVDEVAVPRNVTRCFAYKRRKLTYTVRFRTIIVIFNIAVVASIPHPLTLTTYPYPTKDIEEITYMP